MSSLGNTTPYVLISVIVVGLLYAVLLLDVETVRRIASEDGFVEYFGAASFLVAGAIFAWLYFNDKSANNFGLFSTKKNIFFLLLSLAFVFAAGEEVSWGQRILGFQTPDALTQYNMQREFNIHNLSLFHARDEAGNRKTGLANFLTAERLFAIFWLCYCIVFPLLHKAFASVKELNSHLGVPLVPLAIGFLFLVAHLAQKVIELEFIPRDSDLSWQLVEIKETSMAYLFMVVSLYFLMKSFRARRPAPDSGE